MCDANLFLAWYLVHHVAFLPQKVLPLKWFWSIWVGKLRVPNVVPLSPKSGGTEPHPVAFGAAVGPAVKKKDFMHSYLNN